VADEVAAEGEQECPPDPAQDRPGHQHPAFHDLGREHPEDEEVHGDVDEGGNDLGQDPEPHVVPAERAEARQGGGDDQATPSTRGRSGCARAG